ATVAVGEERADLLDEAVHDVLAPDHLEDLAAVVQVAPLRLGDQPLRVGPQPARLRLGGGDPTVLAERRGVVGPAPPLVRGRPAEAGALGGLRHGYSCSVSA